MVSRILVPMDGSPQSTAALEHALSTYPDASITVLHVIDPIQGDDLVSVGGAWPGFGEEWAVYAEEVAEEVLTDAEAVAAGHEAEVEAAREVGRASRIIVDFADAHDIDHIVIGSHGRSTPSRIALGSVAEYVAHRADVPVTLIR